MEKIKDNILSWCPNLEDGALQQAIKLSEHPWLIGNVCLMPDAHQGYGMPIGGVVALHGAISPNMVGVDIGCSMTAVNTSLTHIEINDLKKIMGIIRSKVPVGKKHHDYPIEHEIFNSESWKRTNICYKEMESARHQLGTLGGGNHFIEIQKGSDGNIWFMIHTGSRNLGKKVADFYDTEANLLCLRWKQNKIVNDKLAVLPMGTEEFEKYREEMTLCIRFAHANHDIITNEIKKAFLETFSGNVGFGPTLRVTHNYANIEHHYNKNVWVHRKGAVLARDGVVIIPGSQGTSSYICESLGNEASMNSCSHGAGRVMSRTKAKEELDLKTEQEKLNKKGILHAIRNQSDLEEASSAYKDIEEVINNESDLIKPIIKLEPLGVIKG